MFSSLCGLAVAGGWQLNIMSSQTNALPSQLSPEPVPGASLHTAGFTKEVSHDNTLIGQLSHHGNHSMITEEADGLHNTLCTRHYICLPNSLVHSNITCIAAKHLIKGHTLAWSQATQHREPG